MATATTTAPITGGEEAKTGPRPNPSYMWFTSVPQKWFALIVRGGDLHRIIHGVKGWYVDEFEFKKEDDIHKNIISLLRFLLGREFVGVPKIQGLYRYKFAWNKFWRKAEGDKETPEYDVQAHDPENIIFTPFESQYPLVFGGIEVSAKKRGTGAIENTEEEALIPVTFVITVRVRMIRPETALMTNVDWLGGVLVPNLQKGIKNFAGNKTYDELIRGGMGKMTEQLAEYMMGPDENHPSDFRKAVLRDAGVDIIDVGVTDIKPNEEFEKALLDLAKAQRDALAVIAKAEGDKKKSMLEGEGEAAKILSIAEAEAERIRKTTLQVAGGPGANATTIEKWRQIHGSGLTTYMEAGAGVQASILVGPSGKPVNP